jgi:hypothetical protein
MKSFLFELQLLYTFTTYWLLLWGGIVQSVSCTATVFSSIVRPHLSTNHF